MSKLSGGINKSSNTVKSPLSDVIIIERNPETGETVRRICPECVRLIREKGETHALDPIYFWGAGIFDYESHTTPLGTVAFLNPQSFSSFLRSMPGDMKRSWKAITGLYFPFLYTKGKKGGRKKKK